MRGARGFHAHGHDFRVVVLLVADRRSEVAQEAQRDFSLFRDLGGVGVEQCQPILEVVLAGGGDEFEHCRAVFLAGDQEQALAAGLAAATVRSDQRRQRLFARRR
jgi:hypothetical protein